MSGIGPANTKPEMMIRRALHALGYRYRLHVKGLPGKPDIVFPVRKAALFVQGCFWHGHDCHLFRLPATRTEFWREKIEGNVLRDQRVREQLIASGWRILDIWECSLRGREKLPFTDVMANCVNWLDGLQVHAKIRGGNQ